MDAYQASLRALTLEKFGLENAVLSAELAKLRQQPPMPMAEDPYMMPGQTSSGVKAGQIKTSPMDRQSYSPTNPSQEAGAVSEGGWLRTPTGLAPVQSKDAKDRTEEDWAADMAWNIRNRVMPTFNAHNSPNAPPASWLPKGHYWRFNTFMQEYQATKYGARDPNYGPDGLYINKRNKRR